MPPLWRVNRQAQEANLPRTGLPRSAAGKRRGGVAGRLGGGDRPRPACARSRRPGGSGPSGRAPCFSKPDLVGSPGAGTGEPLLVCQGLQERRPPAIAVLPLCPTRLNSVRCTHLRPVEDTPKHYVVALGEPNVFSNFSPPRSLTPPARRKRATAGQFAASGSLGFPASSPWAIKRARVPLYRRPVSHRLSPDSLSWLTAAHA
jgi:hypothetical protein